MLLQNEKHLNGIFHFSQNCFLHLYDVGFEKVGVRHQKKTGVSLWYLIPFF